MLTRYLVTRIGKPFLAVLLMAAALFSSYSAANFLQEATNGLLASSLITYMIEFKLLIALEIMLPVALYLGIITAIGKMYEDAEFQAIPALRIGPAQIMRSLLVIAIPAALTVAFISQVMRPWAYTHLHHIQDTAEANVDMDVLLPNVFYTLADGKRVVYIDSKPDSGANNIFVFENHEPQYLKAMSAKQGYVLNNVPGRKAYESNSWLHITDGKIADLGLLPNVSDKIIQIQQANQNPAAQITNRTYQSPLEQSTWHLLFHHPRHHDVGELQWRFATGLSTLFLALLALPLAKAGPRAGKAGRVGLAIVIYFIYYILFTVARNSVASGDVPEWFGLWWAPLSLGLLAAILIWRYFTEGFISFFPWLRLQWTDLRNKRKRA